MYRNFLVKWFQRQIPDNLWGFVWWFPTAVGVLMLPIGLAVLHLFIYLGLDEEGRLVQLNILLSLLFGPFIGIVVLLLVDYTEFKITWISRLKWLARLAIVTPWLLLMTLFWFFQK